MGLSLLSAARSAPPATYVPDWEVTVYPTPNSRPPTGIAFDGGEHLYVANRNRVQRLTWADSAVVDTFDVDAQAGVFGSDVRRIFHFDNHVWVIDRGLPGVRILASDLSAQVAQLLTGPALPLTLSFRNDRKVWVSDSAGALHLFDIDSHARLLTAPVGRAVNVAADFGSQGFAAGRSGDDAVYVMGDDGHVLTAYLGAAEAGEPFRVGPSWFGYAVGSLVVASQANDRVRSLDLASRTLSIFSNGDPKLLGAYDCAMLGEHVLVSYSRSNKVARLTPTPSLLSPLQVGDNPCQMASGIDRLFVACEGSASYTMVT